MIFQNRCWVFGPGVEFTGKGGEVPQSGEERAGRLLLSAPRFAARVPGLRGVIAMGSKLKFLRKGGAERWMAHEHGEFGIGPAEPGTPAGVNIASPGITDS